jgi:hydroxymethylpyrimidine pyrophosphatase-like HAD family hydrolase
MHYVAIAAGFDGTLAQEGACDPRCVHALRLLSASGRRLILVSGRELRDLLERMPALNVFDYIVAENGAVLYRPASRESAILGQAPSELLVQELEREGVQPLSVGNAVIRTKRENRDKVSHVVQRLELDVQIVEDRVALMVAPADVSQVYGIQAALDEMRISPRNLLAIGDHTADSGLFNYAQCSIAVANAAVDAKRVADRVTGAHTCDGFLEIASELLSGETGEVPQRQRMSLSLNEDDKQLGFSPGTDSLLICGSSPTAKAWLCQRLTAELLSRTYQCCVLADSIADLGTEMAALRGNMTVVGSALVAPRVTDAIAALDAPDVSVAVDMTALTDRKRVAFAQDLLRQVRTLQHGSGHPHALLIHDPRQIHASQPELAALARSKELSVVYVATEAMSLPEDLRRAATHVISLDPPPLEPKGGLPASGGKGSSSEGSADAGANTDAAGSTHTAAAAGGTFARLSPSFDDAAPSSVSDRTLVTG